ncbi:MAG: anthranilate phosphoribosyltransferase [Gammaproteobacteria bacterium]|nr:anthranilate phosphoribosyltransferase [Gammaproteobacteria bacterium]
MSDTCSVWLNRLLNGGSLTEGEASDLMRALAAGDIAPALAGALLAGLRMKGETAEEIRGFATAMRELALKPSLPDGAPTVDSVGTGGDGSGSFNLSTGTGLLAAACGARVVKHGNRSISSRSGSADMLQCLGLPMPLDEQGVADALSALNFTFLFAPAFHPAMKSIMPVRSALGVRTVFNLLGPLTNPAAPPFQLIGAFSPYAAKLMADALSGMSIERAFVVHGEPGWDEATPAGAFLLYDVTPGSVTERHRTPEDYGLARCKPDHLAGGDAHHNARELTRVFRGEDKGPHRDALLMGVSLVLEVMGTVDNAKDGVAVAAETIDSGKANDFIDNFRRHFSGR